MRQSPLILGAKLFFFPPPPTFNKGSLLHSMMQTAESVHRRRDVALTPLELHLRSRHHCAKSPERSFPIAMYSVQELQELQLLQGAALKDKMEGVF